MKIKDISVREIHVNDETDDTVVTTKLIGKGMFCAAYQDVVSDDIYLFMREDKYCPGKAILSFCDPSPHIPLMEWIDDVETEFAGKTTHYNVWRTTRSLPLKASCKKAWKQYNALKTAWEEAINQVRSRQGLRKGRNYAWGDIEFYVIYEDFVKALRHESLGLESTFVDAVENLCETAMNYGESLWFEFVKPNLGVSPEGKLILRDVLFDRELVARFLWK